jgi:hypothetical protein
MISKSSDRFHVHECEKTHNPAISDCKKFSAALHMNQSDQFLLGLFILPPIAFDTPRTQQKFMGPALKRFQLKAYFLRFQGS